MASNNKGAGAGGKGPGTTQKSQPPTGPNALVSLEEALNAAIGASIRLQFSNSSRPSLEGSVFTIDPNTHILVLARNFSTTMNFFPISTIQNFTILSLPSAPLPPLEPLDMNALIARADEAVRKEKEKAARVNKNVPKEAQELFDGIGRQMQTRWDGKDIVVMDAVAVKAPGWRSEDCKAIGKGVTPETMARVKKVVENERKKLEKRDVKQPPKPVIPAIPAIPAFAGGPRKGG